MNYGGSASLFDAKIPAPEQTGEVTLLFLAADRAGNTGQHAVIYQVVP